MKKLTWLIVLAGVAFIAACGGGGSGGGASQAAKNAASAAIEEFGNLLAAAELQACFNGTSQQCNCPAGSGAVSVTTGAGGEITATFNNWCQSATGKPFVGTVTGSQTSETITANMSIFSDCVNAIGSGPGPGSTQCTGSINVVCLGEQVSCSWTQQSGSTSCKISC